MAARIYRCYGCKNEKEMLGVDFTCDSENVVCPGCGLKQSDPAAGAAIVAVTILHYEPPFNHPEIGKKQGCGHIACDPNTPTGNGNCVYTGDPRVVNCPLCKQTTIYKSMAAKFGNALFDIPVQVKPDGVYVEGTDAEKLIEARNQT